MALCTEGGSGVYGHEEWAHFFGLNEGMDGVDKQGCQARSLSRKKG